MLPVKFSQRWFLIAFPAGVTVWMLVNQWLGIATWLGLSALPHLIYFFYKQVRKRSES